jgi:hypothetical protein
VKNINLIRDRYDYFLIWGHGLKHKEYILELLSQEANFDIIIIQKYKIKNLNFFIKKVYEYDYVPYFHLKGKTKYLMKTPKEVMFIILKNKNPQEIWRFNHNSGLIQSEIITVYKNFIRDKFNEIKDNRRTEDHVIHASDNEKQTHHMLKFLGYKEGLYIFDRHENKPFVIPYYVEKFEKYKIHEIKIDDLVCNIIFDDKIKKIPVEESPQYNFLKGNENGYINYIKKYQGKELKSYYDLKKFKNIFKNFQYLNKNYENNFILVKKVNHKYLILDGLHRASVLKFQKKNRVIVLEIL